jgi:hypothetical protein
MGVAKELGLTLGQLYETMTQEELLLWSAYFAHINAEQEKQIERLQRQSARRR